jgi:nitrite reductase (NADH) small subunit
MTLLEHDSAVGEWIAVAKLADLTPDCGVAARFSRDGRGAEQIAVFALGSGEVFAIGNRDPFSGINVLSRGLVGDRSGEPKVASPIYKQSFSLRTGVCLDDAAVSVPSYSVRVSDGCIEVLRP